MNTSRGPQEVHSSNRADQLVNKYLAPLALIGGLLLILVVTLSSFDFHFRPLSISGYLNGFLLFPSSYLDFPLNILLFAPFGFGLASLLDQARFSKLATFLSVLLAGFLLTWLVESLQFFLPGRTPNVADLMSNTIGALFGLACFRAWQDRRRFLATVLKPRYLVLSLLIYLILLSGFGFLLRERSRLLNWRERFPLLIGNELTGDRPWTGDVSDLFFLDRALPISDVDTVLSGAEMVSIAGDSLVAYFPLEDAASLADETGNLPELRWNSNSGLDFADDTPELDGRHWLETGWAVVPLVQRIGATSQFTIMLTLSTADLQQTGPARILSVSSTPHYRNLMLGQEEQDLVLRVRMPLTGVNGTRPELRIPNLFKDKEPHTLIITYDGVVLTVYVDETNASQRLDIVPGIAFFFAVFGPFTRTLTLNTTFVPIYMVLFYLMVFIPVGIILALTAVQTRSRMRRILLLLLGILLPALLLEGIFTARIGYELRPANVLLAAVIVALTALLLIPVARKLIAYR